MRILSKSEQDALIQILISKMDLYKFGVLLSLYTGIRIGELCALQWKDIDMDLKLLHVNHTVSRITTAEKCTKTHLFPIKKRVFLVFYH